MLVFELVYNATDDILIAGTFGRGVWTQANASTVFASSLSATANLTATTHGNETGPANIVYTVTLSATNTSGSAITFDLDDLATGTATFGSDYTAIAG
ncbi:MAG: hypothetical protein WKF77_04190, partial [Planctomycetaceae bacterium]